MALVDTVNYRGEREDPSPTAGKAVPYYLQLREHPRSPLGPGSG